MISIVVVGRNDNHGYNLSKRVSSSLNSMARMLSEGDEIIFVDWNTPIGYPVMPVSIKDDLLPKTKSMLRIIRVPQSVHNLVSEGSNRALIEPLARNVGIRRASPDTQWILSTNTDILFASPSGKNFREIFESLEESLWLTFRFEIPEFIWDDLDRRNPESTSDRVLQWYRNGSVLNRIRVDSASCADFPIPDGVGDFQLATKSLWEKATGFPEEMKKGWHVDTRLSLQMGRISFNRPQLISESELVIFHQNHLRNSTVYHGNVETNSISDVKKPYRNSDTWGLIDKEIEEIDLNQLGGNFIESISFDYNKISNENFKVTNLSESSKRLDYNLDRVKFFLADEFSLLTKGSFVHCFTANNETKAQLSQFCKGLGIEIEFPELGVLENNRPESENSDISLLILDYGVESATAIFSEFYGGKGHEISIGAGWIALNTGKIAKSYLGSTRRVTVIRAQNWAIRELARSYFSLPLFNNYTSVMAGEILTKPKLGFVKEVLLIGGVLADYGLDELTYLENSPAITFKMKLLKRIFAFYKKLPQSLRTQLKIFAKWFT